MKKSNLWILAFIFIISILGCVSAGNKQAASANKGINLSDYNNIFVGKMPFNQDDWELYGYSDQHDWLDAINRSVVVFDVVCKKYLSGKNVTMLEGDEEAPLGSDGLYIKFNKAWIDQYKYLLYANIDFIDLKTGKNLFSSANKSFYGNGVGFENVISAALVELSKYFRQELKIPAPASILVNGKENIRKVSNAYLGSYSTIAIGEISLDENEWALWGYNSKGAWGAFIKYLNEDFLERCKKTLLGKNVGSEEEMKSGQGSEQGLFVKFSDMNISYDNYSLAGVIHFIDIKTQKEIGKTPLLAFYNKNYGFEKSILGAASLIASQIEAELR